MFPPGWPFITIIDLTEKSIVSTGLFAPVDNYGDLYRREKYRKS